MSGWGYISRFLDLSNNSPSFEDYCRKGDYRPLTNFGIEEEPYYARAVEEFSTLHPSVTLKIEHSAMTPSGAKLSGNYSVWCIHGQDTSGFLALVIKHRILFKFESEWSDYYLESSEINFTDKQVEEYLVLQDKKLYLGKSKNDVMKQIIFDEGDYNEDENILEKEWFNRELFDRFQSFKLFNIKGRDGRYCVTKFNELFNKNFKQIYKYCKENNLQLVITHKDINSELNLVVKENRI